MGEGLRGAPLLALVPWPRVHPGLRCVLASTEAEGGTISDPRSANFLFSCDASHPDTLRYLKATLQCLLGHDKPGVGDGNCSPLVNMDDRKRLETNNFSVLDVEVTVDNLSSPFCHTGMASYLVLESLPESQSCSFQLSLPQLRVAS